MWQTTRTFSNSDTPMEAYRADINATATYVATGYRVFFLTPSELQAGRPHPSPHVLKSGDRPRLFKTMLAAQAAAERAHRMRSQINRQ